MMMSAFLLRLPWHIIYGDDNVEEDCDDREEESAEHQALELLWMNFRNLAL